MKNKFFAIWCLLCGCFFAAGDATAQQASVSFGKRNVSVVFKIETTSPAATRQSFGSVYFTSYDETERESRVHRVLADRASGEYFGYDLVVETATEAPDKFKISIRPLSIAPPEQMRLSDLTARALPKYPEAMTVEDGDTIALDVLVNPQTGVKIVDLIKITRKKTQNFDSQITAASASGSNASPVADKRTAARDFTIDDVKLRLTSPTLSVNGAIGLHPGSRWQGIIEGSLIHVYIPGKGRFIFSLFPRNNFNFQKNAVVENNKLIFQLDGERYELISAAPVVSAGDATGSWNLWTFYDLTYRPDLIFSRAAAGHIEYGAASEAANVLRQEWRKSRLRPVRPPADAAEIYQKWLDDEVRYIATETEKQAFAGLKTNDEREQFISAFWRRRDPRPETGENEFRREYYDRLAYANQNFAFGAIAGWLSDRGRIFILHGKPDDVQKNAGGETWIYKSLPNGGENAKFEFVNAAGNGDFRLR